MNMKNIKDTFIIMWTVVPTEHLRGAAPYREPSQHRAVGFLSAPYVFQCESVEQNHLSLFSVCLSALLMELTVNNITCIQFALCRVLWLRWQKALSVLNTLPPPSCEFVCA